MSNFAMTWAADQGFPDPSIRRQVLLALAARHHAGPFTVPSSDLGAELELDGFQLWLALIDLRRKGALECSGIGGLMTVTLGCDFSETAEGLALPRQKRAAR